MVIGQRRRRSRGLYRGDQTFPRHLIPAMKAEDASPLHREQAQNLLDMIFERVPAQVMVITSDKGQEMQDGALVKLRPWLDWKDTARTRRQSLQGCFNRFGAPHGFSGRITIYPRGQNRGTLIHECAHALLPWNADRRVIGFDRWGGPRTRNLHHGPNFAKLLVRLLHEFAGEDPEDTCHE